MDTRGIMSGTGHKGKTSKATGSAPAKAPSYRNRILARLDSHDLKRLTPHLQLVSLSFGEPLYEQGGPADAVYFLETGVVSLVTLLAAGEMIETASVGNEGMVGLPAFLGMDSAPGRAFCVIAG